MLDLSSPERTLSYSTKVRNKLVLKGLPLETCIIQGEVLLLPHVLPPIITTLELSLPLKPVWTPRLPFSTAPTYPPQLLRLVILELRALPRHIFWPWGSSHQLLSRNPRSATPSFLCQVAIIWSVLAGKVVDQCVMCQGTMDCHFELSSPHHGLV